MKKVLQLTAVIEQEGDGYVTTCQELDVVSEGETIEEAHMNLVEAVEGFLEIASSSEIKRRLNKQIYVMLNGIIRQSGVPRALFESS